ncbi:hypothetical protein HJG54_20180 [Leptolyngbya sp. NK1-12]|uniref:Uncharacterized protein n=1 Tax=Leptolyngbya sp. NK1-12 TaxID=2547451 RepID=A0AA96WBC1_9CYAN|nr:hypothetical protein [Leptolyngbya sp. NK1-12]WNZ21395.1 hypothetical protein HJG54_20180 [Leptolyngbya sp. NK1-12]
MRVFYQSFGLRFSAASSPLTARLIFLAPWGQCARVEAPHTPPPTPHISRLTPHPPRPTPHALLPTPYPPHPSPPIPCPVGNRWSFE